MKNRFTSMSFMLRIMTLITVVIFFSCSDQKESEISAVQTPDWVAVESLKKKYDLIELSPNSIAKETPLVRVKDLKEAIAVLEKAKSFRVALLKEEEFDVNPTYQTNPSARSLFVCENSWMNANLGGAGMFTTWMAEWYQNGNSGASNVAVEPVGFQIGWSWQQNRVHTLSRNSFCVQGVVQFGIDVGGLVLGTRDIYHVKVDLRRDCTVHMSEGYGFCG